MSARDQMTVAALVDDIRMARRTMSTKNPQYRLLEACEAAVTTLAIELHEAKRRRGSWLQRAWQRLTGPAVQVVSTAKASGLTRGSRL